MYSSIHPFFHLFIHSCRILAFKISPHLLLERRNLQNKEVVRPVKATGVHLMGEMLIKGRNPPVMESAAY